MIASLSSNSAPSTACSASMFCGGILPSMGGDVLVLCAIVEHILLAWRNNFKSVFCVFEHVPLFLNTRAQGVRFSPFPLFSQAISLLCECGYVLWYFCGYGVCKRHPDDA